jgi:hypothetical protein
MQQVLCWVWKGDPSLNGLLLFPNALFAGARLQPEHQPIAINRYNALSDDVQML